MIKTKDQIDFSQWDAAEYDVQGMKLDYANNNFQMDDAESYRHTNQVRESLINGQFTQAREMSASYGLYYDQELERFRRTGVDIAQMAKDRDALREHSRRTRDATLQFTAWHCQVWKPVIAAVNGVCAGGGLHFVADADIVIAAAGATFVDPHVSIGQVVAYEGIALARKSPMESVLRMALVGRHERLSVERAYQLGILSEVVDPPELLRERAQQLAERIAKNSPAALRATKQVLWGGFEAGLTDAYAAGAQLLAAGMREPDERPPASITVRANTDPEGEMP